MAYKHAFQCKKCPERGDEEGCPAWDDFGIQWTLPDGNVVRYHCAIKNMGPALANMVADQRSLIESVQSHRNQVSEGLDQLNAHFYSLVSLAQHQIEEDSDG